MLPYYEGYKGFDGGVGAFWGGLYDEYLGVEISEDMHTPPGIGTNTFLSGWDVWQCPSAQIIDAYSRSGRSSAQSDNDDFRFATFCFNGVFRDGGSGSDAALWKAGGYNNARPKRVTEVNKPSKLIVFKDGYEQMIDGNGDTLTDLYQHGALKDREYFRHGHSCNACFLDGSVRDIPKEDMPDTLPLYTDRFEQDPRSGGPR